MLVKLGNKTINYQIKGQGNPILLIHGWGGNSKSQEPLAELLSEKFRVITIDLPGFGSSSNPDPNWGIEEYAGLIIDFICELKLRPVIYFGHSFGGSLGIYLAANHPNYISKLIISGSSYKRNAPTTSKASKVLKWLPPQIKKLIYMIIFPQSDLYKVPELELNFRKIVTQDLTPLLNKIKSPTLILWGDNDNQTPLSNSTELQKSIKKSKLKIFPGIGHGLPLHHPKLVAEEIKKFI